MSEYQHAAYFEYQSLGTLTIADTNNHYSNILQTNGARRITFATRLAALLRTATFQLVANDAGAVDNNGNLLLPYTVTGGTNQPANPTVPPGAPTVQILGTLTDYYPYLQWIVSYTIAPNPGAVVQIFVDSDIPAQGQV